jgi:hypothetical protein
LVCLISLVLAGCGKSEAEVVPAKPKEEVKQPLFALSPSIQFSKEGYDLIIKFEVGGGRTYYDRFLKHINWPGYSSGLSGGIGYDWAYSSKTVALSDWKDWDRQDWSLALANTSGITGQRAKAILSSYKHIYIDWDLAQEVYTNVTIPRYVGLCRRAFPGYDKLKVNAQWAVLSNVFNRGSGTTGPSRKEVLDMKHAIAKQDYRGIAAALRASKRLWPDNPKSNNDLFDRREAEAKLVETCL